MNGEGLSSISYSLIESTKKRIFTINRILVLGLFSLIVWSAYASIDVLVFAQGKVITSSDIKVVQHLEGGIIGEIFVKKGDQVSVGDSLLQIDNINVETQLAEVQNRRYGYDAALARLEAEIGQKPSIDFGDALNRLAPDTVQNEKQLFNENKRRLAEQTASFDSRLSNSRLARSRLKNQLTLSQEGIMLMSEELSVSEDLLKQGAVSKVEVLQLSRDLLNLKSGKQQLNTELLAMQNEIKVLEQELNQLNSAFINDALNRRNEIQNQRKELLEIIVGATDKSSRSIVRSPVSGVVNQILISTIGGVVQPAMDLIEIVPDDEDYLIDAKIKPEDIGALVIGQDANVRLTAYDFSIYGSMQGKLDYISADTIEEQDGTQYYVAHVRIDSSFVSKDTQYPVLSGMVANVDIATGKRTILSYITKPIVKTKERALREK